MSLSACGPVPPENPINTPDLPTPIITIIHPPTETPLPTSTPTPAGKTAYLTFDDGPDPFLTPQIALSLQSQGVQATFFLTGADPSGWERIYSICSIPDRPDLSSSTAVNTINTAGHAIGIHGWRHDNFWNLQPDGGANEVQRVEAVLKELLGVSALPDKLLRAPGLNWPTVPISGYSGWYYYDITVNSFDLTGTSAAAIINNVITGLQEKGYPDRPIILFHSIQQGTYSAVVEFGLINRLREIGYTQFKKLPRDGDPVNTIIQ
jgi:peptidoglycan/xylan/chitin deacetylase (PgdA/CDA1 family)